MMTSKTGTRRVRQACAVATLILASTVACENTPSESNVDSESSVPRPDRPQVALVMKSLANEFFQTMEDGARAHQQQQPERYSLIAEGIKDELDLTRQIDLIEQMVARGVDAIVIAPADSRALVAAGARAIEAGVTVVNIDNRLDEATLDLSLIHI